MSQICEAITVKRMKTCVISDNVVIDPKPICEALVGWLRMLVAG